MDNPILLSQLSQRFRDAVMLVPIMGITYEQNGQVMLRIQKHWMFRFK